MRRDGVPGGWAGQDPTKAGGSGACFPTSCESRESFRLELHKKYFNQQSPADQKQIPWNLFAWFSKRYAAF
jgi:hypothetical protein